MESILVNYGKKKALILDLLDKIGNTQEKLNSIRKYDKELSYIKINKCKICLSRHIFMLFFFLL